MYTNSEMSSIELSFNGMEKRAKVIDEKWKCIHKYMNVNLNGNLAEIPANHIYVLLHRKSV